jgi:tetratricopeptide (TPR) repeat protein
MARRVYRRSVGKILAAIVLAIVAYVGLQYHTMLRSMDRAAGLYRQGHFDASLNLYEAVESRLRAHRAMRLIPSGDRQALLLNQARVLYALGRYDDAVDRLQREDDISGVATDGRFFLLRGNIAFQRAIQEYRKPAGTPVSTPAGLAESLNLLREGLIRAEDNYRESLQLNPGDWDAKYNYEYVEKMQKDLANSVEEHLKILEESEAPPTEALPPEQVGSNQSRIAPMPTS